MLPVQEKKQKIDFQDCGHLRLQIGITLAIFDLRHPDASYQVLKSTGLSVQEKK